MQRRDFLAASCAAAVAPQAALSQPADAPRRRPIGRSGATAVPPIGMGTWLSFDPPDEAFENYQRGEVLRRFFAAGGGMVDSSPMYGRAEALLGELLRAAPPPAGSLVSATKVWTPLGAFGPAQLERSRALWGVQTFDVLLVHNLLNWRAHLKTLRAWKEQGRVRQIGVSTSHGRAHDEVRRLLRSEPLDVLQITYNLADASAEPLLDLAAERGVAVVANRPFDGGALFEAVASKPLPGWAGEFDCRDWAGFFLKWTVSHPAITCAIPATRRPDHMDQNMRAGVGRWPDAAARRRMQALIAGL